MNKDIVFKKLLRYGLFPEKLTDIFSSENFGNWIIKNYSSINVSSRERFFLLNYKITRSNNAPRLMGIPHPFGFFLLCVEITKNWKRIEKMFQFKYYREKSIIRPALGNKKQRLVSLVSYDRNPETEQRQLDKQFGKKYLVKADIASFFPSVYTHSISWALVGSKKAKDNQHDNKKWYNKLDKACRNIQDGETRGLPIGADTSSILSEVILSRIDRALKEYDYVRFIDDFHCSCETKEEAEKFIRDLSRNLEEFRLCLNTKKTKIVNYPKAINDDWVRKLRQAINWTSIGEKEKDSVIGFLDLSSELFYKNPSESSIRYATQVLKNKEYKYYSTYKLVLRYFLNLSFLFPYIIDTCDVLIGKGLDSFKSKNNEIIKSLESDISKILKEHVKFRRSDAMTWSLFLAIKYQLKIVSCFAIEKEIIKTNDPISILMMYLYKKVNNGNINIYKSLASKVDENEWWLFIYEVSRIENIKIKNPNMERIRKAKITFISKTITSKI